MCVRLGNKHHCLTCISVLSVIQLIWGSPIAALGLFIFLTTSLGALLSPFWAGFAVSYNIYCTKYPTQTLKRLLLSNHLAHDRWIPGNLCSPNAFSCNGES